MIQLPAIATALIADIDRPVTLEFVSSEHSARTNIGTGAVYTLPPTTPKGLIVMAHELGHVATTRGVLGLPRPPEAELWAELKATLWAIQGLEKHGSPVTPGQFGEAQRAFRSYVHEDGFRRITPIQFDAVKAFATANSLTDPAVQALLKGSYGRAD